MNDSVTGFYSESEVIASIPGLTRPLLLTFLAAEVVVPVASDTGPVFRDIDLARLDLLCDLALGLDLEGDALAVVISLIDQLHAARHRLAAMAEAIAAEPFAVRERVGARLLKDREI